MNPIVPDFSLLISGEPVLTVRPRCEKDNQVIHGSFFGQSSFANFALAGERTS